VTALLPGKLIIHRVFEKFMRASRLLPTAGVSVRA
jgi:hypothetical protein